MIMNVGGKPVVTEKGLLSTVLFKLGKDKDVVYGFEGAVECGASTINWLKNSLSLYSTFDEMTELAKSVSDKENVLRNTTILPISITINLRKSAPSLSLFKNNVYESLCDFSVDREAYHIWIEKKQVKPL